MDDDNFTTVSFVTANADQGNALHNRLIITIGYVL
jgi:hypothetical protein